MTTEAQKRAAKKWREANPEKWKEIMRAAQRRHYYKMKEECPEKLLAQKRKYNDENRDKVNENVRKYFKTEKGKITSKNGNHRRRLRIEETDEEQRIILEEWQNIISSQKNRCLLCDCKFEETNKPTMDHIVPLSKGGEHTSLNIQALCRSCNYKKRDYIDLESIQSWLN